MNSQNNSGWMQISGFSKQRGMFRGFIVAGCFLSSAGLAQAQFVYGPAWGGSVGTAESSYLHGAGDVIRSEGLYNLNTARGMVEYENARSQYLANRREAAKNYVASKEFYQAQQNVKRDRARASAAVVRDLKSEAPLPLGPEAINPDTGKITWPKALLDNRFASKRTEVERIFAARARTSGSGDTQKVQTISKDMASALKSGMSKLNGNDYTQARKFLERLAVTNG